ncbi:MAG: hypothetical protein LRY67_05225 [Gammaproteobacteria bacterium]|nr:hypothetical protein [Gammaproteobacteria bacterium]
MLLLASGIELAISQYQKNELVEESITSLIDQISRLRSHVGSSRFFQPPSAIDELMDALGVNRVSDNLLGHK